MALKKTFAFENGVTITDTGDGIAIGAGESDAAISYADWNEVRKLRFGSKGRRRRGAKPGPKPGGAKKARASRKPKSLQPATE